LKGDQFTVLASIALWAPLLLISAHVIKRSSACNISKAKIPVLPSALPVPTASPTTFIGLAIGTQNYTCNSSGKYTNIGAVAEVFDVSCFYKTFIFASLPDVVISAWKAAPPNLTIQDLLLALSPTSSSLVRVLGSHYFVVNPLTGQGINPKWDFTGHGNPNAFVVASKVNATAAPTGSQDIDWVSLKALTGGLAQQVYRTDTRMGQPPASCTPGSPDIAVKYASSYWGFGGSAFW